MDGVEVSVIDFVTLSQDLESEYVSLYIDEENKYSLTNITRTKKGTEKLGEITSIITEVSLG